MRYIDVLLESILAEAPLAGYELYGNWDDDQTHYAKPVVNADSAVNDETTYDNNSFVSKFDRALIQKPESEAALKRYFAKFEMPVYVFFLNDDSGIDIARNYLDFGAVFDPDSVKFPNHRNTGIWQALGKAITNRIGDVQSQHPNALIVILTHNEGGAKRHPMTPWMIVHRMAHAMIDRSNINFHSIYHSPMFAIAEAYRGDPRTGGHVEKDDIYEVLEAICTFRAAREGNILGGEQLEIVCELFTQYMVRGHVILELPEFMTLGGKKLPRPTEDLHASAQSALRYIAEKVNEKFAKMIEHATGKVMVC
jgi:hypothetical protein